MIVVIIAGVIFTCRAIFVLKQLTVAIALFDEYKKWLEKNELFDEYLAFRFDGKIMSFDEYFWNFFYWNPPIKKEYRKLLIEKNYLD